MAEVVEEAVEKTAEGFEEAAELTRKLDTRALGFFAGGLVVGAVISHFVTSARMQAKCQQFADDQIAEMRERFQQREREAAASVQAAKPALDDIVAGLGYSESDSADPEPTRYSEVEQKAIDEVEEANEVVEQNVFETEAATVTDVWDYAVEVKERVPHLPYIIHVDEFTQNEDDYEQITYTWYEEDQVLADVRDEQVDNLEQVVGIANIKFGHGSQDPNVVYVRNERLHLDIEITKDGGSYGEQVHGTIRHSATERRVRPVRGFDDD